mmetsp:Transcript_58370/g.125419  ORF Transcript_58370/g.125419 Transcript_58370/m.125419 type:complete len:223 (+) Transcript_58370:1118-1786(+)
MVRASMLGCSSSEAATLSKPCPAPPRAMTSSRACSARLRTGCCSERSCPASCTASSCNCATSSSGVRAAFGKASAGISSSPESPSIFACAAEIGALPPDAPRWLSKIRNSISRARLCLAWMETSIALWSHHGGFSKSFRSGATGFEKIPIELAASISTDASSNVRQTSSVSSFAARASFSAGAWRSIRDNAAHICNRTDASANLPAGGTKPGSEQVWPVAMR